MVQRRPVHRRRHRVPVGGDQLDRGGQFLGRRGAGHHRRPCDQGRRPHGTLRGRRFARGVAGVLYPLAGKSLDLVLPQQVPLEVPHQLQRGRQLARQGGGPRHLGGRVQRSHAGKPARRPRQAGGAAVVHEGVHHHPPGVREESLLLRGRHGGQPTSLHRHHRQQPRRQGDDRSQDRVGRGRRAGVQHVVRQLHAVQGERGFRRLHRLSHPRHPRQPACVRLQPEPRGSGASRPVQ